MKTSELRNLIREEIRRVIKEADSPKEKAIRLLVQTALDAGNDDELYDDDSPVKYDKTSEKTGFSTSELEHIVMYCLDAAGYDVPYIDDLDAIALDGGGLTGKQVMSNAIKKLKRMGIDIDTLI